MDVNFGVSVLRLHNQYVIQLATELSTTFSALEQAFKEQNEPLSTHVDGYSEKIAELQRLLATETTMFCRRVNAFTEQLRESRDGAALSFQEDNSPTNQADGAQLELEGVSSQQTLSKAFSLSHLARVLVEDSRAAMASAHQTFAHTRAVVQQTEEIFQQLRASRERYTELRAQIGDISHLDDSTLQDDHSPSTDASSCDPSGINKAE